MAIASSAGSSGWTSTPASPSVSAAGPTSTPTIARPDIIASIHRYGGGGGPRRGRAPGPERVPVARVGRQRMQADGPAQAGTFDLFGAVVLVRGLHPDQVQHC